MEGLINEILVIVTCFKEANYILKHYVKAKIGQELDGTALMTRAFSANNPLVKFADLDTENGRNIQLGYMKIFEGAMIGIRNPKSQENKFPNRVMGYCFFGSSTLLERESNGQGG